MHLDIYLWKIWNIIKNFANFALMGILLWEIIKGITGKLDAKKVITKTLIAGILIQASWFMMGALLDVSSIAMTAISSFPINFFGSDSTLTQQVAKQVTDSMHDKTYSINFWKKLDINNIESSINTIKAEQSSPKPSDDEALQSILPNASSVSGPLIFLGMSVFRFQGYMETNNGSAEAITIGFLLKVLVIVMYTIWLALLFVANLIRIVFLWIFIILSPALILANVFFKEKLSGALKNFSITSLLWLVFRPVLFILSLSFALIVIVSFQRIMTDIEGQSLNGVQMSHTEKTSSIQIQGLSTLQISNDSLFKKTSVGVQNTFADLIIFLLSIFLVWYLIKRSLTTGEGPWQELMGKMTGFVEWLSKSMPIFGWFSANQIGTMRSESKKKMLAPLGMKTDGTFNANKEKFESKINAMMGIYDPWQPSDFSSLKATARNNGDFFGESIRIWRQKQEGLSLSTGWKSSLEFWLNESESNPKSKGFEWKYTDFESFFKGGKGISEREARHNRRVLHDLMGGDLNEKEKRWYTSDRPPEYDKLLTHTYFQPTERRAES